MSIITAQVKQPVLYKNDLFTLDVVTRAKSTKIRMEMLVSILTTENLPGTSYLLKKQLPSIMCSKCFNGNDYKFSKEVLNTEIGHLFEHIILENLSELKYNQESKNHIYNGLTSWNWNKDPRGVFRIEIDTGHEDKELIDLALYKSTTLLTEILQDVKVDDYKPIFTESLISMEPQIKI